jgi:23S rRNA (cytosine1962-C5)-methyltransferase
MIKLAENWRDYKLLDCTDGEKFERFGDLTLIRPDPQIIWKPERACDWNADARYIRSSKGGGSWDYKNAAAKNARVISYPSFSGELRFLIRPTDFKHVGIFPEQAVNWDFCQRLITERLRGYDNRNDNKKNLSENSNTDIDVNILNLFAYTGGATVAAAKTGARVCHVDAAKGMVQWAKENAAKSGLASAPIRYITDDCGKFVSREIKRGVRYDGIIMDPPSYGRGPGGEVWKLEDNLYDMVKLAAEVLSDNPLFFILNSYTTGLPAEVCEYVLASVFPKMSVSSYVLGLPCESTGHALPCGSTAIAIQRREDRRQNTDE